MSASSSYASYASYASYSTPLATTQQRMMGLHVVVTVAARRITGMVVSHRERAHCRRSGHLRTVLLLQLV